MSGLCVTNPPPTGDNCTKRAVSVTLTDEMGFRKDFPRGDCTECREIVSLTHFRPGENPRKGLFP